MEQALASWRQLGLISLWRYCKAPNVYKNWHFSADQEGCASLLRLTHLLSTEAAPAYRTLTITDPSPARVDRIFGEHPFKLEVSKKLRLGNGLGSYAGLVQFDKEAGIFTMLLNPEDLLELSKALQDIAGSRADFGVRFGDSNTIINFWSWSNA